MGKDVGNADMASFPKQVRTLEKHTIGGRMIHISDQYGNLYWMKCWGNYGGGATLSFNTNIPVLGFILLWVSLVTTYHS